jgi:hypothetical protein
MQPQHADTALHPPVSARHAEVVPSFIVPALARTLECWAGTLNPGELVRWERPGDLTESARRELRNIIIKRLRPRSEWLWAQPTGVRLADGWRERLVGSDQRGVEAVLARHPERPLEQLALGEFRRAFGGRLERHLAVLARLEALYWTPPPRPAQRPRIFVAPQSAAPVPPAGLKDLAERVLALPWLAKISQQDLRFGYPGPGTLPEWIREQLQEDLVSAFAASLLQKLDEASKMTAAQEARALTLAAGQECLPRMNPDAAERWPAMFLARHISAEGAGKTLAQVGEACGLTRERVRQICEAFEEVFQCSEAVTPALDRALAAIARIAPCGVEEANEQLRRFIGEGAGVECLIAWAKTIGREDVGIQCQGVRRRLRGQLVHTTVIERAGAFPWVKHLINHVSRDTSMFGCSNVLRVAGLLALKEGIAPGQEPIEAALEGSAVFRWLDKETGWFALGETDGSSVATRVRKIMAVAHNHVGADEIAGALASDDMLIYRETQSLGLAVPPIHVLRELFRTWPWLKVVQKGRFTAGDRFDAAGVLSEAEQLAVRVIERNDGVACRFELREAIEAELHLTNVAVSAMLGSSPIFARLEHGLYRLIGRRVGDGAVNAGRTRMRMRAGLQGTPELRDAKPNEFIVRVTAAALKNEQYNVPARFHSHLAGRRIPFRDAAGQAAGEARISQSGALSGFNRCFAPKPGDLFRVAVGAEDLCVELVPATGGIGASGALPP